ncbi:Protein of unknown function [Leuconostoc citreum LBAE C11]|nr:Protein of unknown function [Leuconostoc citreum LBAE C11]
MNQKFLILKILAQTVVELVP